MNPKQNSVSASINAIIQRGSAPPANPPNQRPPIFPDAEAFLDATRALNYAGPVHVVGGRGERRVTLFSQQCRALNIAAALHSVWGDATDSKSVAVIGAGASGITAATALKALGANVNVFEIAATPLHAQRASRARFLHPRLFTWPEIHWDSSEAGLPIGDWTADCADEVRNQILREVGPIEIDFCREVVNVYDASQPRVRFRNLGALKQDEYVFDAVLVATGFPMEVKPDLAHVHGGSYWHAVETLDRKAGTIRVAGDGDGALTELIMILLDRYGHEVVEALAHQLPLSPELRAADLRAQGMPKVNADPPLASINPGIVRIFELVRRKGVRVILHADNAMTGSSFLLNRVFVEHFRRIRQTPVEVVGANLSKRSSPNGGPVVWRIGLANARPVKRFEIARLNTREIMRRTQAPDPEFGGLLAQTVDALRRPMWSADFENAIAGALGFSDEPVVNITKTFGSPTREAMDALDQLGAVYGIVKSLGLPLRPVSVVEHGGKRWFSIESLVRVASVDHLKLLEPSESTNACVGREKNGRIWLRTNTTKTRTGGKGLLSTRNAVAALVAPGESLRDWAWTTEREDGVHDPEAEDLESEVLRAVGDLAGGNDELYNQLFEHFVANNLPDYAIDIALIASRRPAEDPHLGRVRKWMRRAGEVAIEWGGTEEFSSDDGWVLVVASASRMSTFGQASVDPADSFLEEWRTTARQLGAPEWYRDAVKIANRVGSKRGLGEELARAAQNGKTAKQVDSAPVARFGVWFEFESP